MTHPAMVVDDLEEILERAFWKFDALHKAHYRDVEPSLPGPMSERDAFKRAVRSVVLADVLGVPDRCTGGSAMTQSLNKQPALRIIRRLVRRVKAQEKVLIAYRLGSSSLSETTHRELDATRDAVEEAESYLEGNA